MVSWDGKTSSDRCNKVISFCDGSYELLFSPFYLPLHCRCYIFLLWSLQRCQSSFFGDDLSQQGDLFFLGDSSYLLDSLWEPLPLSQPSFISSYRAYRLNIPFFMNSSMESFRWTHLSLLFSWLLWKRKKCSLVIHERLFYDIQISYPNLFDVGIHELL